MPPPIWPSLVEQIINAEPELAKVATRLQPASQRRRRRKRLAYAAAATAVLVGAPGLAVALRALDRNSSNEEGPQVNQFTAASPWRLVVDNNIVGPTTAVLSR
jgi:hypothetical protein